MSNDNQQPPSDDSRRNEPDGLPLVPKPPRSLQKSVPGAKRILSGMVADTLALVKKQKLDKMVYFALVGDTYDTISWMFELGPQLTQTPDFGGYDFVVMKFNSAIELLKLTQTQIFDLIVINLTSINWDMPYANGDDSFEDVTEFLGLIRTQYGKPIIVFSSIADTRFSPERFAQIGVHLLNLPCTLEEVRAAFEECLNRKPSEEISQQQRTRPPRIVIVNDNEGPLRSMEIVLRGFQGATLSLFQDSSDAWEELLRADPDLLIVHSRMPKLGGVEIIFRLLDRKAAFPVIVTTTYYPDEPKVREAANRGLNATVMRLPFDIQDFKALVEGALKNPGAILPAIQSERGSESLIYVVDDDPHIPELAQMVLKPLTERVKIFHDPEFALQSFISANPRPDLIITDHVMPKIDGFELISQIRRIAPKQKILMTSSWATLEDEQRARADAVGFLISPYSAEQLMAAVSSLLAHSQPLKTRPLRVTILDDEDWRSEMLGLAIGQKYPNATVRTIKDGDLAWQELTREDPDLLITDVNRDKGLDGYEIVSHLAAKKAKYPVLVYSGLMDKPGEDHVKRLAGPNLPVKCLYCPFTIDQFYGALSELLDPGDNPKFTKSEP